jgi:hypothetical protein
MVTCDAGERAPGASTGRSTAEYRPVALGKGSGRYFLQQFL